MANTFNDVYQPISEDAFSRIPAAMKAEARWVVWGGKKIPVNGNVRNRNGFYVGADATDPAAWMDFNAASALIGAACQVRGEYFHIAGFGFVVGDGWFCIDADGGPDHGREPVPDRVISDLCKRSGTYAEMSISKNGCHLFGKCGFNTLKRKEHFSESKTSYEIEFFTRRKFLIVTGDHVPGSAEDAIDCNDEAHDLYDDYVLTGCNEREEEERKKRETYKSSITINPNDAQQFFLLNYPEILEYADVDHFKRGGKSGQLAPGEYSWIGAIKAMDEIGVPRSAIYEWCRRGASFAGEKDIDMVLDEKRSSQGRSSTASIVKDAIANGWKPDSDKLTGEYKEAHEAAASGNRTYGWDDIIDMETGEIFPADPAQDADQQTIETISGITVHNNAKHEAAKPAAREKKQLVTGGYDDVEVKPTDFLFFPWFPRGKLVSLQGDSGSSKSTFMYAVGALVSTGSDLLGVPCEDPGNVMFITIEDDPGDIKTAFLDSGGDLSKLKRIINREDITRLNLFPAGAQMIDNIIKAENIKLLVLDPIQQFLNGDMNKANDTRPQLARLMNIAAENNICIVFIEHMGKDTSKSAIHRGIGSVDIGASTRSMIQVATDPEDDFFKIAFTVKNNTADFHDTQRAIRYQVKDHPGSFNQETRQRDRFHGHAEFSAILPEYNERLYKKAVRKAEEAEEAEEILQFSYDDDPLVITARELISYNPQGLFIGSDDLIQRITQCAGHCPYELTRSKLNGLNNRISKLRGLMIDTDGIQADIPDNAQYAKAYHWRGILCDPQRSNKIRGVYLTPVKNGTSGAQQTKI